MTEAAESVILTTGWPCVEKVVDRFILGEQQLNRDLLGTAGHSQGALLCCRMTELSVVAQQHRSRWHSVAHIEVL